MHDDSPDLSPETLESLEILGHEIVPELIAELMAPARRGRDLAVLAGTGSGKEALYALAAAERCRPDSTDVQALILTPTTESAARASRYAYELAGPEGIHALAWSPEFSGGSRERPVAQLVAGRPDELMEEVRAGRLGIENVSLLVLDEVNALLATDPDGAAEEILDTAGEDTQVIATSDRPDEDFLRIAERRLDRPRRWPRELLEEGEAPPVEEDPGLDWGAAPTFDERMDVLARGLRDAVPDEPTEVLIQCSGEAAARRVAGALSTRGFHIASEPGEPGVGVAWGEEGAPEGGVAVWFGLPSGLPGLRRTAGPAARRLAVVHPREVAQLHLLARRAGWSPEAIPGRAPQEARRAIARYRDELRNRIGEEDPGLELLVLEPLVEAHGFPDLAATLSAWIRELRAGREEGAGPAPGASRPPSPSEGGPPADRGRSGTRERRPERSPAKKSDRKTPAPPWTRLFIPVGERDDVRPGDLVGAITGETDAAGGQIGKIEIRDSYSLVEVESGIADHVIREISGATIRGRRVEARRDREA